MNLPQKYSWLNNLVPLPKVIAAALQYLGVKEIPGHKSNPIILKMAADLNLQNVYTNDDTSWCALFASYICDLCGKPLPDAKGDPYNRLRAHFFLNYGIESKKPELGDVLVFQRPGGGHVGFYIAESKSTYFVLGGNQSNAVTIAEIEKSRLVGARRFYHTAPPSTVKVYEMNASGLVSKNEA